MQPTRARTKWERAALPVTGIAASTFGALSALRRNRVFHPVGEAFTARLVLREESGDRRAVLGEGTHDAYVRLSRGLGLPEPSPDILGLAIKILELADDGDQDLLLASSGRRPVARNLLIPARSFLRARYSSVLPYRVDDAQVVVGARATGVDRRSRGDFGEVRSLVARGALNFELLMAGLDSDWEVIGSVVVEGSCPQEVSRELRFNPWNTKPELQPAGPLNTLRNRAYTSSQRARPA